MNKYIMKQICNVQYVTNLLHMDKLTRMALTIKKPNKKKINSFGDFWDVKIKITYTGLYFGIF